MIIRRVAGLGLWALLFQLTVKSSDLACANHALQPAQTAQHVTPDQSLMSETPHHDHEPASEQSPCEIPAQSDCCQALVSCSITLGLGACDAAAALRRPPIVVVAPATHAPAYLIRAPEPPPPKA